MEFEPGPFCPHMEPVGCCEEVCDCDHPCVDHYRQGMECAKCECPGFTEPRGDFCCPYG